MLPQGSAPLNLDYFNNLTRTVQSASSCAELQAAVAEAFASIGATKAAMAAELAKIEPMLALLTIPAANPGAIVTWITSLVTNYLTPQFKPAVTYATQIAALTVSIAELTSAINAASAKFPSCTVTPPTI